MSDMVLIAGRIVECQTRLTTSLVPGPSKAPNTNGVDITQKRAAMVRSDG